MRIGEGNSFVLADIPGLIEGAHTGAGLGHHFLRHLERTKVLIHVLDMSEQPERTPWEDFRIINEELKAYKEMLASRPQIVAANKMDLSGAEERLTELKSKIGKVTRFSYFCCYRFRFRPLNGASVSIGTGSGE